MLHISMTLGKRDRVLQKDEKTMDECVSNGDVLKKMEIKP